MPIGPLFADRQFHKPVGQFLPEDTGCLEWLDAQADRSVVYVAFGSFTVFNPRQFEELALGLELAGRPFLWVVRPDFTAAGLSKAWLDEFRDRVGGRGMIVSWCPQQQVHTTTTVPRHILAASSCTAYLSSPCGVSFHWTGAGSPCGGVLRVALRVELDDGRGEERGAVPVLALLHGPVPERELHLQRVEDRLGGGAGAGRRRDEGGAERQSGASPWRRRDQGEGERAQGCGVQVHRRGWVVA